MSLIRVLPPQVVNQIAAGEVVERPANMVKELIENGLDAGADKIEIRFAEGGLCVQVIDNGKGITPSDMPLALSPHSTSKISSAGDLWKINTYGFRGEALASIAEVSDLVLISKPSDQKKASRLQSLFGEKQKVEQTGAVNGTTVIVKKLFQNIPARRRFLKSESAETSLIKNTVKAMALAHPHVEFRVLHKNRLLFYWAKKDNLKDRAKDVLSLKAPFYTQARYESLNIQALLCPPNETAPNRRQMWLFAGNRWVEDSTLYSAVLSAYRGLLMHGEYPILVLKVSCPPEELDVNVHPAKARIRFKNNSLVFKAVHHIIRDTLEKAPWLAQTLGPAPRKKILPASPHSANSTPDLSSSAGQAPRTSPPPFKKNLNSLSFPKFSSPKEPPFSSPAPAPSLINTLEKMKPAATPSSFKEEGENYQWASLKILAQAHLTYIITQSHSAVIFIDQHAAHERVLYERLMLHWSKGKGETQHRLIPLVLDLDESLIESLHHVKKDLLQLGVEIEQSGPGTLVVQTAPALLKDTALHTALVLLAEEIKIQGKGFALEKAIGDVCASMACHSAIRAGQALKINQMQELLNQMDEFPLSSFCPHGRPVFVKYPLSRLERDFCRRV